MDVSGLKGKQGAWVKSGETSGRSNWPGGYKGYMYIRAPPSDYPKTAQQKEIADAGRACKGTNTPHECIIEQF